MGMSCLFLVYAYFSKVSNFMTDSFLVENDNNPWNNRRSEDYMRHLKAEMHTIVYPAAFITMEATIGFEQGGTQTYGPHDANPCKVFFGICLIPRVFNLISLLIFGIKDINWGSDRFKM